MEVEQCTKVLVWDRNKCPEYLKLLLAGTHFSEYQRKRNLASTRKKNNNTFPIFLFLGSGVQNRQNQYPKS